MLLKYAFQYRDILHRYLQGLLGEIKSFPQLASPWYGGIIENLTQRSVSTEVLHSKSGPLG